MFAAKSLAESGIVAPILADTRLDAARGALARAGRSYIMTWRLSPNEDGTFSAVDKRAFHPDDLKVGA